MSISMTSSECHSVWSSYNRWSILRVAMMNLDFTYYGRSSDKDNGNMHNGLGIIVA